MKNNLLLTSFATCLLVGTVAAQRAATSPPLPPPPTASAEAKPAEAKPTSHTIAKGTLKNRPVLDAIIEAAEMTPVKIEPKAWADFTVLEAVPHGARVKKGDILVKCDAEKLREQIDELEQDRAATVLGVELAQAELKNLEETTPTRLEAARRANRNLADDFAHYESYSRTNRDFMARFNLKGAEERNAYAAEELKQLEKMYKADDLTEETEEIILRRTRFQAESSKVYLESQKQSTERDLKVTIPREHEAWKLSKRDSDVALIYTEETLPRTLAKKRYDLVKLQRDQRKADKRLADLKKDADLMVIRAPADGVVYYGACDAGKWTTGAMVAKKLLPTGKILGNEVIITIVSMDKLQLRAVAKEEEIIHLRAGLEGKAAPVFAPDKKLTARVEDVSAVPMPGGGYETRMTLQTSGTVRLVPGMNAKVNFNEGQKTVLLAPKEAVFTEDDRSHVFIARKEGKPEKRTVKTGESDAKMTEITTGLKEGDKILLQKPE